MSRRPPRFQQADVTHALRAAQQVGGDWAVEIEPDGTTRIVPVDPVARQKRRQNSTDAVEDRHPGSFFKKGDLPSAPDQKVSRIQEIFEISQAISSTRPRSRVQVEYEEAQSKYEEFRQGLIAERRARRRHGIRQPPLSGIPELASAAATLNQKLDAVVEEMNAVWDAAEREYLSRASK
ncbi:MAG: hypothetical protein WAN05_13370 [Roseiarcus sp.]